MTTPLFSVVCDAVFTVRVVVVVARIGAFFRRIGAVEVLVVVIIIVDVVIVAAVACISSV